MLRIEPPIPNAQGDAADEMNAEVYVADADFLSQIRLAETHAVVGIAIILRAKGIKIRAITNYRPQITPTIVTVKRTIRY